MNLPVACPFCRNERKKIDHISIPGMWSSVRCYECSGCGSYYLTERFEQSYPVIESFKERVNCAFENLNVQDSGQRVVWLGPNDDEERPQHPKFVVRSLNEVGAATISHSDKMNNLLIELAKKLSHADPFSAVTLAQSDLVRSRIGSNTEASSWLRCMASEGWINWLDNAENTHQLRNEEIEKLKINVSAKGWLHIETLSRGLNSREAFVAMSFKPEMAEAREAIRAACTASGWQASLVDENEYTEGVTDEILALIRRSAFVIADFTGHRNGVYFEAGFGRGLTKTTIHTVKESDLASAHFDTRHLNHIVWENTEELEKRLTARIRAVIPGSKMS